MFKPTHPVLRPWLRSALLGRTCHVTPTQRGLRSAFTLIELLISLAVLSVALAVVATVFSITSQTASQAAAYSQTQNWLRKFTLELREDLRGIIPSQSVLVLRGRTIPASLTPETLDAAQRYRVLIGDPRDTALLNALGGGDQPSDPNPPPAILNHYSDPRADLMMFLTHRPLASNAPPVASTAGGVGSNVHMAQALQNGTKFAPSFITYGHAALATATLLNPGTPNARYVPADESAWRHINQRRGATGNISTNSNDPSRVPAQEWILARRQLLVIDDPTLTPSFDMIPIQNWTASDFPDGNSMLFNLGGSSNSLIDDAMIEGQTRQFAAGDAIRMVLTRYDPLAPATSWGLLTQLSRPSLGFSPSLAIPYGAPAFGLAPAQPPLFAGGVGSTMGFRLMSLMYPGGADVHASLGPQTVACVIPNPPPDLRSNLGLQALPGCVWFQVEFLQPEDPRNHPEFFDWTPDNPGDNVTPTDAPRWVQVPNGAMYMFVPDSPENRQAIMEDFTGGNRNWTRFGALPPDVGFEPPPPPAGNPPMVGGIDFRSLIRVRTWPYAIRITVRATDPKGRLDEPIVRTIIHRFD